jgi:hypothetical protein
MTATIIGFVLMRFFLGYAAGYQLCKESRRCLKPYIGYDKRQAALGVALLIALLMAVGWLGSWFPEPRWASDLSIWFVYQAIPDAVLFIAWAGVVILAIVALCVVVCVLGNGWQWLSKWLERHL